MNGLKAREGLFIQARVKVLSVKKWMDLKCILDSSRIVLASQEASTAACNSRRGTISCLRGAIRDLAATSLTS